MKQEDQRSLYVSATCTSIMALTSDHKLLLELVLHKIWGAAACPPQAFSIRPLPGFSLGAVSRLISLTRQSQSVLVCLKTIEFSPMTPAHSAGPGGFLGSCPILVPFLVSFLVPFLVPFLVSFLCQFLPQNGPQNGPKIGPKIDNFGVHFWIPFFQVLELFGCVLGAFLGFLRPSWSALDP